MIAFLCNYKVTFSLANIFLLKNSIVFLAEYFYLYLFFLF